MGKEGRKKPVGSEKSHGQRGMSQEGACKVEKPRQTGPNQGRNSLSELACGNQKE